MSFFLANQAYELIRKHPRERRPDTAYAISHRIWLPIAGCHGLARTRCIVLAVARACHSPSAPQIKLGFLTDMYMMDGWMGGWLCPFPSA